MQCSHGTTPRLHMIENNKPIFAALMAISSRQTACNGSARGYWPGVKRRGDRWPITSRTPCSNSPDHVPSRCLATASRCLATVLCVRDVMCMLQTIRMQRKWTARGCGITVAVELKHSTTNSVGNSTSSGYVRYIGSVMEVHHPVCILALGSGQRLLHRLGSGLGLVLVLVLV